jgi:magnesium transporter
VGKGETIVAGAGPNLGHAGDSVVVRQRVTPLVSPLRRLLRRGARAHAANLLFKLHAADVARLISLLDAAEIDQVFDLLLQRDPDRAGDVLAELDDSEAAQILDGRADSEVARILAQLDPDDAAAIVADLPADIQSGVLELLEQAGHDDVEGLLGYAEETAGRIMSPEIFTLHEELTVGAAIEALRSRSEDLEMVFYLYVVDARSHLVGVCSLRDLILGNPADPLGSLMNKQIVAVNVDTDQEEVAQLVARYNYLALPVVDHGNKLVGIITVDDVIDIMREEETEDILLMAGVGEDEEEVLTAPLRRNVILRLPWLFAAWVGGVLASLVIDAYEGVSHMILLVPFIPIIVGMGGNVGTQAATIIVRGMATGRLADGQRLATVFREIRVSLALGIIFGALLGMTVWLTDRTSQTNERLAVAVSLSLITSMAIAASVGATVPILLKRFGVDPAIATGPFVTTAIDVLGIVAYFSIASVFLLA